MYGKEEATLMGEVWNLQKQKLGEIKNTSDEWWINTIAEFNAIAEKAEGEAKTCIGYHAIAALRDLEAKATGRQMKTEMQYLGEMTAKQFIDHLEIARSGDCVRIGNKWVEVH